jgi:GDP-D-mannose dehydratase
MIFSGELSSQFWDKILLEAEVQLCTAFKGNFDIEQWLQCSFNHVNNNRGEKFIADSCSVSVCQIVQDQNIKINNIAVII